MVRVLASAMVRDLHGSKESSPKESSAPHPAPGGGTPPDALGLPATLLLDRRKGWGGPWRGGEPLRGWRAMTTTTGAASSARSARSADEVLAGLDPEQLQVATALRGPVCVLAGAGTGKTRAITHRIAYGVQSGVYVPQHVLAVTFTARAAGELRTRLRALGVGGVQARTFHAAALRQLSYFWPQTVGGHPPGLQEHKASLVAEAASRLRLSVDRAAVRDLSAE